MTSVSGLDLADLVHLEQDFFDAGYADGTAHGRVHGLIEGRALGRTKGFELWEEIGFYEGFARVFQAACRRKRSTHARHTAESRIEIHIRNLLDLIATFPPRNPSMDSGAHAEVDLTEQLSRIRARYRALCATAGIKPRLRTAASVDADGPSDTPPKRGVWNLD